MLKKLQISNSVSHFICNNCIAWINVVIVCASVLDINSKEVEFFVSDEIKFWRWHRFAVAEDGKGFSSIVSCEFCNTFVLVRDNGLCFLWRRVFNELSKLYKSFRIIANYFLSRNKIKFRHSFVSAQVFESSLSSSSSEGYPLQIRHKQNWGWGFILLLPQTAALPESDAGSNAIKPALSLIIQNRQTSCSMWCPMYRARC